MWRETYDVVLRESADEGGGCAAEKMLAALISEVDVRATDADTVVIKAQLSAIGRGLVQPLRDVLKVDSKTPRSEKLSRFQLQVVCRLLLCCEDGVFDTEDREGKPAKTRRRGKEKASSKKSKTKAEETMSVRSELRELLDRIALLIDSANPPSIADSEDEPSPFYTFLISVLEKHLVFLLPQVFAVIREEYELTDDEEPTKLSVTPSIIPIKDATPTGGPVADSVSFLSALKGERPSKKRSLAATSDAFKEVVLPGQQKKTTPTKQRISKLKSSAQSTGKRVETKLKAASSTSPSKSVKRLLSDSSLVSLAAESKKSKPSRSSSSLLPRAMTMPMLLRNVDRQMLPTRSMPTNGAGFGAHSNAKGTASALRSVPSARGSALSAAQLSRTSVVMRTPDRPQRSQRSQPRILIEASPPLRNPFATASHRRPGPQMPN